MSHGIKSNNLFHKIIHHKSQTITNVCVNEKLQKKKNYRNRNGKLKREKMKRKGEHEICLPGKSKKYTPGQNFESTHSDKL